MAYHLNFLSRPEVYWHYFKSIFLLRIRIFLPIHFAAKHIIWSGTCFIRWTQCLIDHQFLVIFCMLRKSQNPIQILCISSDLLFPRFPDIRLISKSGLFSITNHRCLNHLRVFQSTICLDNQIEFALAHALFFHINKLKLDPTFFKETFCFLCIITLLCPKNLYIPIISPYPLPYVSFFQKTL